MWRTGFSFSICFIALLSDTANGQDTLTAAMVDYAVSAHLSEDERQGLRVVPGNRRTYATSGTAGILFLAEGEGTGGLLAVARNGAACRLFPLAFPIDEVTDSLLQMIGESLIQAEIRGRCTGQLAVDSDGSPHLFVSAIVEASGARNHWLNQSSVIDIVDQSVRVVPAEIAAQLIEINERPTLIAALTPNLVGFLNVTGEGEFLLISESGRARRVMLCNDAGENLLVRELSSSDSLTVTAILRLVARSDSDYDLLAYVTCR